LLHELHVDCWPTLPSQPSSVFKESFRKRRRTETTILKLKSICSCTNRFLHWLLCLRFLTI